MNAETVTAIGLLALVTFSIRAGGLALAHRLPREGAAARWLRRIPPAILVAIVAPSILAGGAAEAVAAAATLLVAARTRSLPAAIAVGIAAVWAMRSALA
jgi:uncharacterized membrane protein